MNSKTMTLYHGTDAKNRDSILTHGLIPAYRHGADYWARQHDPNASEWLGNRVDSKPSVFLAHTPQHAQLFSAFSVIVNHDTDAVIFEVSIPTTHADNLVQDEQDFEALRYTGSIPASWIKVHSTIANVAETAKVPARIRNMEHALDARNGIF